MMTGQSRLGQPEYSETRLGFTLESDPQWSLNDQVLQLPEEGEQANVGTAGKIGIGVAAVAAVVVFVGIIYLTAGECGLGDSGSGDDCGT